MTDVLPPYCFVEDTTSDYEAARRALRQLGVTVPTVCFSGIQPARDYLLASAQHPPGLIVLDWRLPDGNGSELLELVRGHETLRPVPVAIWSASADPAVIASCYRQGADTFIAKTANRAAFGDSIRQFALLWKPLT
jgi:two-component system sensor histidine kinase/response regulator